MRTLTGGVAHIAAVIEEGSVRQRYYFVSKAGIADLCASALTSRCANTAE